MHKNHKKSEALFSFYHRHSQKNFIFCKQYLHTFVYYHTCILWFFCIPGKFSMCLAVEMGCGWSYRVGLEIGAETGQCLPIVVIVPWKRKCTPMYPNGVQCSPNRGMGLRLARAGWFSDWLAWGPDPGGSLGLTTWDPGQPFFKAWIKVAYF